MTARPAATATAPATAAPETDTGDLVRLLIGSRFSVPPKRLRAPGPSPDELRRLIEAAATAPDHRGLRPWRLVQVPDDARERLAGVFEAALRERDMQAAADDVAKARAKAFRAPVLLLAVVRMAPEHPDVSPHERHLTLGAALMALLLAAHGMGYGGMLTSGRSMASQALARAFGLGADEQAVCFVSLGTPVRMQHNPRPTADELLSVWRPD